jgi:hypothetical protein
MIPFRKSKTKIKLEKNLTNLSLIPGASPNSFVKQGLGSDRKFAQILVKFF